MAGPRRTAPERVDLQEELIHDWRRRYPDFPKPVARLAIGYVWAWPDVEHWARKTGRL
jgi:hypothetical protein